MSKPRVLIVEDDRSARTALREMLESEGFRVTEADRLAVAMRAVRKVAFHVACIDLGLDPNDPTDLQGRDVLREVAARQEGTRTIILSQKEINHITVEAYEQFRLGRYLTKGQVSMPELIETIREEAAAATLSIFESYGSAFGALLHERDQEVWIDQALRALEPKGGFITLRRTVEGVTGRLSPLRPHRDPALRTAIDFEREAVSFSFWSRARGVAIVCVLSRGASSSNDSKNKVIERVEAGGMMCHVYQDLSEAVEHFLD